MTPESRKNSFLGNGSTNTFPRKRTRATIKERYFLRSPPRALLPNREENSPLQQSINQQETTEEAVFSMCADPKLYSEELSQLGLELSRVPELAVAAKN
jgi:hypothetical protein